MRVVIADDSGLLRDAVAGVLTDAGIDVCATAGDADQLAAIVAQHRPDAAIIDIRMPPTYTHEGAQVAVVLRKQYPRLAILLLSQSLESRYAAALARAHPQRFGYLLKDRVAGASVLVDAVRQIVAGGTILDPNVVTFLLSRNLGRDALRSLTERERDVLGLVAEGRSNAAISKSLFVNSKTVEGYIANIFQKLDLRPETDDNRRVLAVLHWLQVTPEQPWSVATPVEDE